MPGATMNQIIALLTDFGLTDNYVGIMKGVIAGISPESRIIDISHDVLPQHIEQAAYLLTTSYTYFPNGTIFICVVDPGVGSSRKPVAVKAAGKYFIAPDNGLLSCLLSQQIVDEAVVLDRPEYRLANISKTFHGRDIFAPAGAHLAKGVSFCQLGSSADPSSLITKPLFINRIDDDDTINGRVIHIDRFGNIVTSFHSKDIDKNLNWLITLDEYFVEGLKSTFSDVETGHPVVYIGSARYLEIGIRNGNAANRFKAKIGMNISAKPI